MKWAIASIGICLTSGYAAAQAVGQKGAIPSPPNTETLVRQLAPEVRLHSKDSYRPTSTEWYMQRVHMRLHRKLRSDDQVLNKGQVTPATIASQNRRGQSSGGTSRSDFFLQIPNDRDEDTTRKGDLNAAVCYAHTIEGRGYTDIQYWFFYAYNGDPVIGKSPIKGMKVVGHEGDFEHITVRVVNGKAAHIYYAAHEGGTWHPASRVMNAEGRPVVYSAHHSHGSFPTAGWSSFDHTDSSGPVWRTWERVEWVDKTNPTWLNYSGHWGEMGNFEFTSGPYGPKLKDSWVREAPGPGTPAYTPRARDDRRP